MVHASSASRAQHNDKAGMNLPPLKIGKSVGGDGIRTIVVQELNPSSRSGEPSPQSRTDSAFHRGMDSLESKEDSSKSLESPLITLHLRLLDKGEAKLVYEDINDSRFVYYLPVSDDKAEEVFSEGDTAALLRDELASEVAEEDSNLHIDQVKLIQVDPSSPKGATSPSNASSSVDKRRIVIRTRRANSNLEKTIRNPKLDLMERVELCLDVGHGFKRLQSKGAVHGDAKTDNVLVQGNKSKGDKLNAIISDWGKFTKMFNRGFGIHKGNTRLGMAPEGYLSKKGEVYSLALILVRILEEGVFENGEDCLISLDKDTEMKSYEVKEGKERRGIEKFVVQNKYCPQFEHGAIRSGLARVYNFFRSIAVFVRGKASPESEREVHRYISVLIDKYSDKFRHDDDAKLDMISGLRVLLEQMTRSNPAERPTMGEVHSRLQVIRDGLSRLPGPSKTEPPRDPSAGYEQRAPLIVE